MYLLKILTWFLIFNDAFAQKGKILWRRFEFPDDHDVDKVYLVTEDLREIPLNGTDLENVPTGTDATLDENGRVILGNSSVPTETIMNIDTIVFPLNICGLRTTMDIGVYETLATSMKQYFDSCSIQRANFSQRVLRPIEVPCNGSYATNTCSDRDIVGWAQVAEAFAAKELKIDLKMHPYRMFVIPYTTACPWLGLADVGCLGGGCRSWIKGGPEGYSLMAAFHEIGHNMGLRHAMGPGGEEYGDYSAAMGGCCAVRCHNVPQAWALKWYDPIGTQNTSTWMYRKFEIPSMLLKHNNFVNINNFFFSYRTKMGYDSGLPIANLVYVHSFNGSRQITYARSQLVNVLNKGGSFEDPMRKWFVNVTGTNNTHAVLIAHRHSCGNRICETFAGETCKTCPVDCMQGVTRFGPFCCGSQGKCKYHWRCTNRKVSCT